MMHNKICTLLFQHRRNLNKLQKLFLSVMEFRKREIIDMKKQLFHWKRLNDREESIENIVNICLLHSLLLLLHLLPTFCGNWYIFSNERRPTSFYTLHWATNISLPKMLDLFLGLNFISKLTSEYKISPVFSYHL